MKIINRKILEDFKRRHPETCSQVDAWYAEVENANWATPHELKKQYGSASILKKQEVVFNIKGNKYRLLVKTNYQNQVVLVKKAGTHKEYAKW